MKRLPLLPPREMAKEGHSEERTPSESGVLKQEPREDNSKKVEVK